MTTQKQFTSKIFRAKKQLHCQTTFECVLKIMQWNGMDESISKFLEPSMKALLRSEAIKLGHQPVKPKFFADLY